MANRHPRQKIARAFALPALALVVIGLPACKTPSINLATSEPIKVDITMRLDVYNHEPDGAKAKSVASATPPARGPVTERAKNREADIQTFKNSRLVGESHDGLLAVITEPAGDYGDTVRRTVAAENADRMGQMKALADKEKRSLADVQKEQAALWANRSFKGEWIETKRPDNTYAWTQKRG